MTSDTHTRAQNVKDTFTFFLNGVYLFQPLYHGPCISVRHAHITVQSKPKLASITFQQQFAKKKLSYSFPYMQCRSLSHDR